MPPLPKIIRGGMGVGVSGWSLAFLPDGSSTDDAQHVIAHLLPPDRA